MAKNLALQGTTAEEYFKLARSYSPQFRAMTQDLTYKQLQAGYEGNSTMFDDITNKWFGVVMAMRLNKISVSDFKDVVGDLGIIESYSDVMGAITQRLYIHPLETLEPAWLGDDGEGLKDGDTVDPWIVIKGKMTQMFWKTNFNFQTGVTLQPYERKQILSTDFGMDEISAGYIRQLYVTYGKERQLAALDCLNAMINSEKFPLRPTQKIAVKSWTETDGIESVTPDELTKFLALIGRVARTMDATISSSAWNAMDYETAVDKSQYVVIMRPDIMNQIQYFVEVGAFNPEKLNLPFETRYLLNFGGMIPTDSAGEVLYPVRTGKLKRLAGWATTEGAAAPTITDKSQVTWVDPNEEVLAIIVQKGAIFTTDQNGIRVRNTGPNPRAEYDTNYFNLINAGMHGDPHRNMFVITKPSSAVDVKVRAANLRNIRKAGKAVEAKTE